MSERDAFGNPIEQGRPAAGITGLETGDPLRAPAQVAATVAPAPAQPSEAANSFGAPADAPPAAAAPPASPPSPPLTTGFDPLAWAPPPQPTRGSFDWFDKAVGLFFVLLFVVPFGVGGWFAYSAWHDTAKPAISVIKDAQRQLTPTVADPGAKDDNNAAARPPRGLASGSLLKPAAVRRVIASARRDPGGRLRTLRLAPDRANLQLTRANGGLSILQLGYDGGRSLVRTPSGGAGGTTIAWGAIDAHAPQRLVTAAAHRLGRSTKSVDYLVAMRFAGELRWAAYFKSGAAFQADAHGRITRRIQ